MYTPRFVYSFICGWTRVAIEHLFMCLLLFDCLLWRSEMKVAQLCPTLCNPVDCPWNSPGQNTGVDSLFLLQGIFPTQELNPGLPHCRQILYQISHKGSPRMLVSVAGIPSPADFPDPGIIPGSPALQAVSLPTELSGMPTLHIS